MLPVQVEHRVLESLATRGEGYRARTVGINDICSDQPKKFVDCKNFVRHL